MPGDDKVLSTGLGRTHLGRTVTDVLLNSPHMLAMLLLV